MTYLTELAASWCPACEDRTFEARYNPSTGAFECPDCESEVRSMGTCTGEGCDNMAEFALWIGGEFSRVHRSHSSSSHEQGDLHPFVCSDCRPIYAEMFQNGEFRRVCDA